MALIFLVWICIAAVCDAIYRKCFNWIAISGGLVAILTLWIYPELHPVGIRPIDALLGGVSAFFGLLIFYHLKMMGAGDVKFAAALGLWVGWELMLPIWALSCVFAVMHGFFSRSQLKYLFSSTAAMRDGIADGNRKFIPYVTYLCIATIVVLAIYKN